jgi:hypothetical protein
MKRVMDGVRELGGEAGSGKGSEEGRKGVGREGGIEGKRERPQ